MQLLFTNGRIFLLMFWAQYTKAPNFPPVLKSFHSFISDATVFSVAAISTSVAVVSYLFCCDAGRSGNDILLLMYIWALKNCFLSEIGCKL